MNKINLFINILLIEVAQVRRIEFAPKDDPTLKCTKNLDELQTFLKPTHSKHTPHATVLQC